MREIGGYIEFEHYRGTMLHDNGIKLNSGRNCLAYLFETIGIKRIAIPYFLCNCIEHICNEYDIKIRYYNIDSNFNPVDFSPLEDEYFYLVNYYGQLQNELIIHYKEEFGRVILDNAHAYFNEPISDVATIYTCRKFFGVPDGGILFSTGTKEIEKQDESFERFLFLVGRYERNAKDFFQQSTKNEAHFERLPLQKMSRLTENILHSIDYDGIKEIRKQNFIELDRKLNSINDLNLSVPDGPYMYPLLVKNGEQLRRKLIEQDIYVPCIWPNVIELNDNAKTERYLAANIVPLPIDQRYCQDDMDYIAKTVLELI